MGSRISCGMIFRTQNSLYEVDAEQRRIRRLSGSNIPTPRQGEDRVWRTYVCTSAILVGYPVLITWVAAKGTRTSPVTEIDIHFA
jgi:hypothetical protein